MNTQIERAELEPLLMKVGSDFDLTQGLGGNVSFKNEEAIWVKASGKRLVSQADESFYYQVRRAPGSFVDDIPNQQGKASIEVFMHAFFEGKYVIHLHSAKAVALGMMAAIDANADREARAVAEVIPYARPGIDLLEQLKSRIATDFRGSVLLENHGVLHIADSVLELELLIGKVELAAENYFSISGPLDFSPKALSFLVSPALKKRTVWHLTSNWRISPDHCVFLGTYPPNNLEDSIERAEATRDILQEHVEGRQELSVASEQLLWFLNVVSLLPEQLFPTLTVEESQALCDWDAEKHRLRVSQT